MEGLVDAYTLALQGDDAQRERQRHYAAAIQVAMNFLQVTAGWGGGCGSSGKRRTCAPHSRQNACLGTHIYLQQHNARGRAPSVAALMLRLSAGGPGEVGGGGGRVWARAAPPAAAHRCDGACVKRLHQAAGGP